MRYSAFALGRTMAKPMAWMFDSAAQITDMAMKPLEGTLAHGLAKASFEVPLRFLQSYTKLPYELSIPGEDGAQIAVEEEVALSKPFCDLVHFPREGSDQKPKVLIVAALSGHFATLLRDTAQVFVPDNDVYITDWTNARDVSMDDGDFGFDDYVSYIMEFVEHLGPDTHIVATCQSAPQALIATALLAENNPDLNPKTLTLMAGPVDTRVNPGFVNKVSDKLSTNLLSKTSILTVPWGFKGAGRKVYPGFYQLSGFISLNIKSHAQKHIQYAKDIITGDTESAEKHREFYDEYFTVLDMTEKFYLETLENVFFDAKIPKGTITYHGNPVDFTKIRKTALLTLEGGGDDMCPVGQTQAAHGVCSSIPKSKRGEFIHPDVGHYGIFSGQKWRDDLYPIVQAFIDKHGQH